MKFIAKRAHDVIESKHLLASPVHHLI